MGRNRLVVALALCFGMSAMPALAYASRGLHVPTTTPLRRQLRVRGGMAPHAAAATTAAAAADDSETRRLGFIGLGIMGLPMAKKLLEDNNDLVVWNRGQGPSADLLAAAEAAEGGGNVVVASSPKEVIEKCGLTYSMLSDLAASEAVYHAPDGILAGFDAASEGHAIVDCATLTAEHMKALDVAVRERGGRFLEAPVSGSKVRYSVRVWARPPWSSLRPPPPPQPPWPLLLL